jgi:opacity protein-like surface antigen
MKSASIIFILFLHLNVCSGQQGSIHFSLNNGFNYSNFKLVKIDKRYASKWKTSYRFGAGIGYELVKNLKLGIECNIEEKGWFRESMGVIDTINGNFLTSDGNYYYPFTSFPIIIHYAFGLEKVKLFVEGAYLINLRRKGTNIKTEPANTIPLGEFNFEEPKVDYGWMYGVGLKVNIDKNWTLALTGRYASSHTGVGDFGVERVNMRHQNYAGLLSLSYRVDTRKP